MAKSLFLTSLGAVTLAFIGMEAYGQENKTAAGAPAVSPTPTGPRQVQAQSTTISKPLQVTDFDSDSSGDVSADEFFAYHAERIMKFFESLDADKDGKLVQAELERIKRRVTTAPLPRPSVPAANPATPQPQPPVKTGGQ